MTCHWANNMFFFMLGLVNYCPDEMELEIPSGEVFANKIREIQRKLEIAYQMLTPILGHSEYSLSWGGDYASCQHLLDYPKSM